MRLWPLMLIMPVIGCETAPPPAKPAARNGDAFCDAVMGDIDRHADALAEEASDRVVLTGQPVIAKTDAFCAS